jgi:subtilase-type serine protease
VWSAGNGSGAVAGITAMPRWKPELEPYWLAVANVRRPNAAAGETDYVIDGSSSICAAANWCISAPGTDILSTIVSGDIQGREENYVRLIDSQNRTMKTGTSMAAHITGALGLLMERFPTGQRPGPRRPADHRTRSRCAGIDRSTAGAWLTCAGPSRAMARCAWIPTW